MATNEPETMRIGPAAAQNAGSCGADELKGLLSHIADQIGDADKRHSEVLRQMQERLALLANEARSVRARAPEQFAENFERIEGGMAALAERLGEASSDRRPVEAAPMALRSAAGQPLPEPARSPTVDTFDVLDSRLDESADPWDALAAEALTNLHESGATGFAVATPDPERMLPGPAAGAAPVAAAESASSRDAAGVLEPASAALPVHELDKVWLADQISALARRLEQSITDISPTAAAQTLEMRFSEFEERLASALDVVATRSDVEALGLIEAHIGELAGHLDSTQIQLSRLDGIEAQLQSVVAQLSDERLAQVMPLAAPASSPADLASLAADAAERAAARVTGLAQHAPATGDFDEIRSMLARMIDERRLGEEQTISMLDTMQQALIRVLDRVDAMEVAHHRAQAQPRSEAPRPHIAAETLYVGAPLGAAPAPAAPAPVQPQPQPQPQAKVQIRTQPEPDLVAGGTIDRMRQDLKAEAQRAKHRAESEAQAAAATAAGAKAARGPAAVETSAAPVAAKGTSGKRKMMLGALVVVLAAMGSTLFMKKTKRPPRAEPAKIEQSEKTQSVAPAAAEGENAEAQTAGPEAAAPEGMDLAPPKPRKVLPTIKSKGTITPMGAAPAPAPAPAPSEDAAPEATPSAPETVTDDLSLGEEIPDSRPTAPVAAARTGEVLMPLGMTLQSPTSAPIASDIFNVAGAGVPAMRTALVPEQAAVDGSVRSSALDLPPLTVGPLSLRLAAAKGDPSAEFEVGARLAEGKGTNQNFKEAMRWYLRSATRGFAQAQYRLGTLFERGLGAPADLGRARIWYQRAAEQGNVKAMHNLAVLSAGRENGTPDYPEAARWFRSAAERNLADSQFNIGVLAESGLGVEKDPKQAYKWFTLAAAGGDKEAVRRRDLLKSQFTPVELAEAEALANTFSPVRVDPIINDARVAGEDWKKRQSGDGNG